MKSKSRAAYGSFHLTRHFAGRLLKSWSAVESPPLPVRFRIVAPQRTTCDLRRHALGGGRVC